MNRTMVRERIANSIEGMTELAERSGGTVTKNLNDFRAAFGAIAADLSSYYSLGYRVVLGESPGFRAGSNGDEGERRLEVRMRDPHLTARARTSIPVRTPEMEIADAVLGRLAFPGGDNDLGISAAAAEAARKGRRRITVPIDVRIPLEPLSFTEEGESFAADISIYLGAADAGNANTEVRRFDLTAPHRERRLRSRSAEPTTPIASRSISALAPWRTASRSEFSTISPS